jgi:hypothetical protein
VGDTLLSEIITEERMTLKEIQDYYAGYVWNEQSGEKKEW